KSVMISARIRFDRLVICVLLPSPTSTLPRDGAFSSLIVSDVPARVCTRGIWTVGSNDRRNLVARLLQLQLVRSPTAQAAATVTAERHPTRVRLPARPERSDEPPPGRRLVQGRPAAR